MDMASKEIKSKLALVGLSNWEDENYIRFRASKNNKQILKSLDLFLGELDIQSKLSCEENEETGRQIRHKYKKVIGNHHFFKSKKYKLHVVFGENRIHLIIKTDLKNRKELSKNPMKYAKWVKVEKKFALPLTR